MSNLASILLMAFTCFVCVSSVPPTITPLAIGVPYTYNIGFHEYIYFSIAPSDMASFWISVQAMDNGGNALADPDMKVGVVAPTATGSFSQETSSSNVGGDTITISGYEPWFSGLGQTVYIEVYGYAAGPIYILVNYATVTPTPSATATPLSTPSQTPSSSLTPSVTPSNSVTPSVSPGSLESSYDIATIWDTSVATVGSVDTNEAVFFAFVSNFATGFRVDVVPMGNGDPDIKIGIFRPNTFIGMPSKYSSAGPAADSVTILGNEFWFTGVGQTFYIEVAGAVGGAFYLQFTAAGASPTASPSRSASVSVTPSASRTASSTPSLAAPSIAPTPGGLATITTLFRVSGFVSVSRYHYFQFYHASQYAGATIRIVLTAISGDPDLQAGVVSPLVTWNWFTAAAGASGSDMLEIASSSSAYPTPGQYLYIGVKGYSSSNYILQVSYPYITPSRTPSQTPSQTASPSRTASRSPTASNTASISGTPSATPSTSPGFATTLTVGGSHLKAVANDYSYFVVFPSSTGTYSLQTVITCNDATQNRVYRLVGGETSLPATWGGYMNYEYEDSGDPCGGSNPNNPAISFVCWSTPCNPWYFEFKRGGNSPVSDSVQFSVSLVSFSTIVPTPTPARSAVPSPGSSSPLVLSQLGSTTSGWVSTTSDATKTRTFTWAPVNTYYSVQYNSTGENATWYGHFLLTLDTYGGTAELQAIVGTPCITCNAVWSSRMSTTATSRAQIEIIVDVNSVSYDYYVQVIALSGSPSFTLTLTKMYDTDGVAASTASSKEDNHVGMIVGIVVSVVVAGCAGLCLAAWFCNRRQSSPPAIPTIETIEATATQKPVQGIIYPPPTHNLYPPATVEQLGGHQHTTVIHVQGPVGPADITVVPYGVQPGQHLPDASRPHGTTDVQHPTIPANLVVVPVQPSSGAGTNTTDNVPMKAPTPTPSAPIAPTVAGGRHSDAEGTDGSGTDVSGAEDPGATGEAQGKRRRRRKARKSKADEDPQRQSSTGDVTTGHVEDKGPHPGPQPGFAMGQYPPMPRPMVPGSYMQPYPAYGYMYPAQPGMPYPRPYMGGYPPGPPYPGMPVPVASIIPPGDHSTTGAGAMPPPYMSHARVASEPVPDPHAPSAMPPVLVSAEKRSPAGAPRSTGEHAL